MKILLGLYFIAINYNIHNYFHFPTKWTLS